MRPLLFQYVRAGRSRPRRGTRFAAAALAALVLAAILVPALAWPLHILMDSFSHGDGRWQTLMLYPFSDWHFHGVNWWQHPGVMLLYWGILPVLWIVIRLWRRSGTKAAGGTCGKTAERLVDVAGQVSQPWDLRGEEQHQAEGGRHAARNQQQDAKVSHASSLGTWYL